jgi:hypothetical protein
MGRSSDLLQQIPESDPNTCPPTFNKKSRFQLILAGRYDHFGAILAIHFAINTTSLFPLQSIIPFLNLSHLSLSLSIETVLSFSLSVSLSQ